MDLTERREGATRHPWEVQRFEAYRRILEDHGALGARRLLDVGAGDGWFSDRLAASLPDDAQTVCWDVNYDDHDLESARPGLERTRVRPDGFDPDLVLLLDVIEHIPDPVSFLNDQLAPLVRRGVPTLVAVPAYQRLFSAHDVALGHHRRYGRRQFLGELREWVDVREHGSLFTSLLLPRAAQVVAERRRPAGSPTGDHGVGGWTHGATLTTGVNVALGIDARVGRALGAIGLRMPGLSHWAFGVTR